MELVAMPLNLTKQKRLAIFLVLGATLHGLHRGHRLL